MACVRSIEPMEDSLDVIRELVSYAPAEDYHDLKNGDTITVEAVFNEQALAEKGFVVTQSSAQYTVQGVDTILQGSRFSEGTAWVQVEGAAGRRWIAADAQGQAALVLPEEETPVTVFADGICIVDFSKVIDKAGKVVWSVEEDGIPYADEHWGMENVRKVSIVHKNIDGVNYLGNDIVPCIEADFFGKVQVVFSIDTWDYTGDVTGFLNPDGTWYMEPTQLRGHGLTYREDGVYSTYDEDSILNDGNYNVLTGELVWRDDEPKMTYDERIDGWKLAYRLARHDNLEWVFRGSLNSTYFADASGEAAIDLSAYTLNVPPYPAFGDGYCTMVVENHEGSEYYTVLDTTGARMFEPRKLQSIWPVGVSYTCSEGKYWANVDDTYIQYFTIDGQSAFDCPLALKEADLFHEDMARVKSDDGLIHYINASGELIM